MATEWFYQKDGKEIGPLSSANLRQLVSKGHLLPNDLVRKADMDHWARASALKGLFPATLADMTSPSHKTVPPAVESETPQRAPAPPPAPVTELEPAAESELPLSEPDASVEETKAGSSWPTEAEPPEESDMPQPLSDALEEHDLSPASEFDPEAAMPEQPARPRTRPRLPVPPVMSNAAQQQLTWQTPARSKPRWIWYGMALTVVLCGGGGAFFYFQKQANQNMSIGPGLVPNHAQPRRSTSAPAPADAAPQAPDPALEEVRSDDPLTRVVGFRRVLARDETPRDELEQLQGAARETLADKKQSPAWTVALQVLGRIGTPEDMRLVSQMTAGTEAECRCAALAAAMLISPGDAVRLYEPIAGDTAYNSVMNDVLLAGPRREPVLLALLKSDSPVCRKISLASLASCGTEADIDPINRAKATEIDAALTPDYQAAMDGINARIGKH